MREIGLPEANVQPGERRGSREQKEGAHRDKREEVGDKGENLACFRELLADRALQARALSVPSWVFPCLRAAQMGRRPASGQAQRAT